MTRKRTGRRRWAALVRFLKNTMETSKSERTRMTAALRLADVLALQEQRDIAELKAASRKAEAPGETAKGEAQAGEQQQETAGDHTDLDAKAAAIFGPLISRGNDASASQ